MTPIKFLLPPAILAALRAESERTGASMGEIVRRALAAWLARTP